MERLTKKVLIGVLLLCGTMPGMLAPGGSVMAQGGEVLRLRDADLLFTSDLDGTVGFHMVNWGRDGIFTGLRISVIRPEGERVSWSAVHAEQIELSTFRGYGREQYVGVHGGFAFHQKFLNTVVMTGIGIMRERRFRQYYDEDMGEGHEIYHMLNKKKQRFLIDLLLGVYHRGDQVNIGLSLSLATRSINAIVGFPISLDTLRNG